MRSRHIEVQVMKSHRRVTEGFVLVLLCHKQVSWTHPQSLDGCIPAYLSQSYELMVWGFSRESCSDTCYCGSLLHGEVSAATGFGLHREECDQCYTAGTYWVMMPRRFRADTSSSLVAAASLSMTRPPPIRRRKWCNGMRSRRWTC